MATSCCCEPRRANIPVFYCRGTHYEVGYSVGRTFMSMIKECLAHSDGLNKEYLPIYETAAGKRVYDETLAVVTASYPQYVKELEGLAAGAEVDFVKLFLLHMDDITLAASPVPKKNHAPIGCTTVCSNGIIGHTEDAFNEVLNHIYILSAHIVSDEPQGKQKVIEERFSSLCYAGQLPGYTMGFNHHGCVYSINTLSVLNVVGGKMPRAFITRALLAAETFKQAQDIIVDDGVGAGNGCSVNITFLKENPDKIYNIEMAPALPGTAKSQMSVLNPPNNECITHCNKYLRLAVPEVTGMIIESSIARMSTIQAHAPPKTLAEIKTILSDDSNSNHPIFVDKQVDYEVQTVAVGILDCKRRTWSIYANKPACHEPLVVLPIILKD